MIKVDGKVKEKATYIGVYSKSVSNTGSKLVRGTLLSLRIFFWNISFDKFFEISPKIRFHVSRYISYV